jgi:flagellar hook-associated protein 3 FlgL
MIVNKSMFPLQTGFGVISKMQDRFATLQMQLGTGEKASKLSEMGRDLPLALSVRQRLTHIQGFSSNIATVDLRLSFLDKTLSRLDVMEGEARNSAVQGQYGTNNINMATVPGLSKARFDELVTTLNLDVAGRYLFGGANTDNPPLPDTTTLFEGYGAQDGFKTVLGERKAADLGVSGTGRINLSQPTTNSVALSEDGVHPFGFKILRATTNASASSVTTGSVGPSPVAVPPAVQEGNTTTITFAAAPAEQIVPGQTITLSVRLPDGIDTQVVMTAISADDAPAAIGQFVVNADPDANAASFQDAMDKALKAAASSDLAAASTFAASAMFFNGPGEPPLRVEGDPATASSLRVATEADTVMWYRGQSPAVAAEGLGRLNIATNGGTVSLTEKAPLSDAHGFQIVNVSGDVGLIDTTFTDGATPADPATVSVAFGGLPTAGQSVQITVKEPNGNERVVSLKAVEGRAGPGQFSIGLTAAETAANFSTGLQQSLADEAADAQGNPRQSVTAQVDDSTRVGYGLEANESGLLRMVRTFAAMSVETYSTEANIRAVHEPKRVAAMALAEGPLRTAALAEYEAAVTADSRKDMARFDAMARRQQSEMSEGHNAEPGSIEILTMELAVARNAMQSATKRHTDYKAQLDNLLSDIETVSKEDVAMEILALQTRLQASYQATSMVSKLSLVNFI